jgi:hypothetical protein
VPEPEKALRTCERWGGEFEPRLMGVPGSSARIARRGTMRTRRRRGSIGGGSTASGRGSATRRHGSSCALCGANGPSTSLTSGIDGKTVAWAVWETGGVADEYERRNVADEHERRDEPVEGAPRGGDPEVHLHTELGEEAKRLATHPREEAHRLSEELKAGEVETTPLIALTGIGIALGLFIALVIALVFVVAYLI